MNGCSGGGSRSSQHLDNLPDLIDGSVSQAWGHLGALQWSAYDMAGTILGDKIPDVVDALSVGGSGDPYKGLNKEQAAALKDLLVMGYPRDGIAQFSRGWVTTPASEYYIRDHDPGYFQDFWTKPGYLGHDNPKAIEPYLIDATVTVTKIFTAGEVRDIVGFVGASDASYGANRGDPKNFKQSATIDYNGDPNKLFQSTVTILSGKDKGRKGQIISVRKDNLITPFLSSDGFIFENVEAGDKIAISNRDYLAFLFYYRYAAQITTKQLGLQTPDHPILIPELKATVDASSKPKYVQRDIAINTFQPANFKGKMIALSGTSDEPIWPTSMTAYDKRVRQHLGQKYDDQYRLWWIHNGPHCAGQRPALAARCTCQATESTPKACVMSSNGLRTVSRRRSVQAINSPPITP